MARVGASRLLWALALLVLVLWAIGRLASDRWLWSQYLSWAPSELVVALALSLLLLAWAVGIGIRRSRRGPGRGRGWLVHALPALLIGCAGVSVAREHHVWRWLGPAARDVDLRIVYWNASNAELEFPPTIVSEHGPDLAIIAHPRWRMGREMLYTMVHEPSRDGPRGSVLWRHGFAIASRHEVLRSGAAWLGLRGVRAGMDEEDGATAIDRGSAVFLVLDTVELVGRETTVWALDLPSDPGLHRREVVERALAAMAAWEGPDGERGFPAPDLIVGDLNIPSGSWSLSRLGAGMGSAHEQAGRGAGRTWPRGRPWWRIDHVLLGERWRAVSSGVVDPGVGRHRMVVVGLEGR